MRQWMCNPKIMCRQHLLGEYREHFTILGTIKKKISIQGYINNDLIEPKSILKRYKGLKKEMLARGYKPKVKFKYNYKTIKQNLLPQQLNHKIDKDKSLKDLLSRCEECRRLIYYDK